MQQAFVFHWRIENYSMCLKKVGCSFDSSIFDISIMKNTKGSLRFFPGGKWNEEYISCYLILENESKKFDTDCIVTMSYISNCEDIKHKSQDYVIEKDKRHEDNHTLISEKRLEIFKDKIAFLQNDILVIECEIKERNCPSPQYVKCYGKTTVKVTEHTFEFSTGPYLALEVNGWISKLQYSKVFKHQRQDSTSCEYQLSFCSERQSEGRVIYMLEVCQKNNVELTCATVKLSLLSDVKPICLARSEHLFRNQLDNLPMQLSFTLNDNQIMSLQNRASTICSEFRISDGSVVSTLEQKKIGLHGDIGIDRSSTKFLETIYGANKYSDIVLQVGSDRFPANKCILAAFSPVFDAMFESDMKENKTNVINIEDIDADTVNRMVRYLYTGMIEDMNWDIATKLYFAADKYQIVKLKRDSSNYLLANMFIENVLEVLELAIVHSDKEIENAARNYIFSDHKSIFGSRFWDDFMERNFKKAAELMLHVCMRI